VPHRRLGEKMRAKRFTKTIAFRVTPDEYELLEYLCDRDGIKNPSTLLRKLIQNDLQAAHLSRIQAVKRLEAAARRAAKKAATTDAI